MQDRALAAIGKLQMEKDGIKVPYMRYIQNMFPGKKYKMALLVFKFDKLKTKYKCQFKNIDVEDVDDSSFRKYMYRKGSARGGDWTFTTKYGDIEKKIETIHNIKRDLLNSSNLEKYAEEKMIFEAFSNTFDENKKDILKKLLLFEKNIDKKEKTILGLSIAFEIENKRKYLDSFNILRKIILSSGSEGRSEKHNVISKGKNNICSVCLEKKENLFGFAAPFKFYTIDKKGFASNFFKQECSWKNYPICTECADLIETGRDFIIQNFKRYFYGNQYYIIPRIIIPSNKNLMEKTIKILSTIEYQKTDEKTRFIEDEFLKIIAKEENYFNVDLLFFEEDPTTKSIKIKLMLEEIFPSRFRKIFVDIPNKINSNFLYQKALTIKKEKTDLKFYFGILKYFFDNDFLSVTNKIFLGIKIDPEYLYSKFINKYIKNYREGLTGNYSEPGIWVFLKSHLVLNYLQQLELINYNKNYKHGVAMNDEEMKNKSETKKSFDKNKFIKFIEENKGFFDSDYKIGVFSLGVLVKYVMNNQARNLGGNTPFENKLHGYKLNPDLLKNIYTEALEKLNQYAGQYAHTELREIISKYFNLNIHILNKISNNELSYYFVSGLEMANNFKSE
jgi:CRISPR-associated protein Csh1